THFAGGSIADVPNRIDVFNSWTCGYQHTTALQLASTFQQSRRILDDFFHRVQSSNAVGCSRSDKEKIDRLRHEDVIERAIEFAARLFTFEHVDVDFVSGE